MEGPPDLQWQGEPAMQQGYLGNCFRPSDNVFCYLAHQYARRVYAGHLSCVMAKTLICVHVLCISRESPSVAELALSLLASHAQKLPSQVGAGAHIDGA